MLDGRRPERDQGLVGRDARTSWAATPTTPKGDALLEYVDGALVNRQEIAREDERALKVAFTWRLLLEDNHDWGDGERSICRPAEDLAQAWVRSRRPRCSPDDAPAAVRRHDPAARRPRPRRTTPIPHLRTATKRLPKTAQTTAVFDREHGVSRAGGRAVAGSDPVSHLANRPRMVIFSADRGARRGRTGNRWGTKSSRCAPWLSRLVRPGG